MDGWMDGWMDEFPELMVSLIPGPFVRQVLCSKEVI